LVILTSTILGRAISDCLGKRQTSRLAGKGIASRSAAARGLQTNRHRRTAAGKGKGVGPLLRESDAGDKHHAAGGRLLLVLPAVLRSARGKTIRWRRGGTLLDGLRSIWRRRFVCRRNRARAVAPALLKVLAESVIRPGLRVEARAVSAVGEPGDHPRGGQ